MQKILFFLILVSFSSCRTTSSEPDKANKAPNSLHSSEAGLDPRSLPNIHTDQLAIKLHFQNFSRGKIRGVRLEPIVDDRANYINYEIVSLDDSDRKIYTGTLSGLAPELRFDLPTGHLKISYQACVLQSRAHDEKCGPKISDRWLNVKNPEDSSEESLKIKQTIAEYQKLSDQIEALPNKVRNLFIAKASTINQETNIPSSDREAFSAIMSNYLLVDPYVLADFYNSDLMYEYSQSRPEDGDQNFVTWSTALMLNFANPDFINEQWSVFIESANKRWDLADRRLQRATPTRPSFQSSKPSMQRLKPVVWDAGNMQMQAAIKRMAAMQIAGRIGQRFGLSIGTALHIIGTYIIISWGISSALELADTPQHSLIQDLEKIGEEFGALLKDKNEKLKFIKSQLGE